MRFNVSMDDDFVQRLDEYASLHGQSRSSVLRLAAESYLDAQEQLPALKAYLSGMFLQTGAVVAGEISPDEYKQRLDDSGEQLKMFLKG